MKKYRNLQDAKEELYKLMEKASFSAGIGEKSEDYTETLSIDIGGGVLSYDPYYQQLRFFDAEDMEYELDDDLEAVNLLIEEINKRLKEFEKRICKTRTELVEDIFEKPINGIIEDE